MDKIYKQSFRGKRSGGEDRDEHACGCLATGGAGSSDTKEKVGSQYEESGLVFVFGREGWSSPVGGPWCLFVFCVGEVLKGVSNWAVVIYYFTATSDDAKCEMIGLSPMTAPIAILT